MLTKCDVIVLNTLVTEKTRGMFNKEKIAKLEKDTQAFRCLFQWLHREGRVHKSGETDERNITSSVKNTNTTSWRAG
ncbi:formate dehydrogenase (NAD+) [Orobanche gracilis]